METQVVIIGGGVMGTAMARGLSRYDVDTVLVERNPDVCFGISKASNGMIYTGLTWLVSVALKAIATSGGGGESHLEKDRLCLEGYENWEGVLRELDVPYRRTGVIVIARNAEELKRLEGMQAMAKPEWNLEMLDRDTLLSMEPNVTHEAIAALYDESHVLNHYPWDVVIALAENAKENGIKFMLAPLETNYVGESFWHLINLPFHEAGHIIFRPFGRFMTSLGGSLAQLLMPLICLTVFLLKTKDTFAASFCLWWFGENFMDLAPYINDARTLTLPLLGGNTGRTSPYGFHDWEFILKESGLIR